MPQKVMILTEKETRRIIKNEIDKRFFFYDKILDKLHIKIVDLERMMEIKK
jgi:hypothetical protein